MAESQSAGATPHRHRGTRAIARMVEYAPSTGGLALWVKHQNAPERQALSTSGSCVVTDGCTIFYGAEFEKLPLPEQVGHVAHEVLHIALRHPQRYLDLQHLLGDVDLALFNICADAIVNSALSHVSWLQLPSHAVYLDKLLKTTLQLEQPVDQALLQWDVETLYRAVDDRAAQGRRGKGAGNSAGAAPNPSNAGNAGAANASRRPTAESGGPGQPAEGQRAARVLAMGRASQADLVPGPATQGPPEEAAEAARQWRERLTRAHAGDGAHSMLRTLMADLPRTRTPWEQVLRTQLARSLSQEPELSWSRPSRSYLANQGRSGPHHRMPFEPGTSPNRAVPRLVLVVDVSGSIDDELMQRFAREIEAITRRLAAGITLVVGDDRVQRVEVFKPGRSKLSEMGFNGGGGTDFTPLLEEADRHHPDITVVLTDLDGPARYQPRCPVLWAVPQAFASAAPPFGRKLVLS
ncbi:VWA-like domain-containing protein [Rhodoferax sp. U2-2l]|uniref:vWA domain-containing protein n=1 Tax=Rhodoferax sp. U2-2l TaxID=2884000 RepID=UPI001D0AF6D9|nr:VWA-like domain-containing protein [Rhodoferax sp. U2-2l]